MTIKGPSRKQIIVSMSTNNSEIIISQVNKHISNINRLQKDVKSDISADFICFNNKAVALSDLSIVKKYIKELNINTTNILSCDMLECVT